MKINNTFVKENQKSHPLS